MIVDNTHTHTHTNHAIESNLTFYICTGDWLFDGDVRKVFADLRWDFSTSFRIFLFVFTPCFYNVDAHVCLFFFICLFASQFIAICKFSSSSFRRYWFFFKCYPPPLPFVTVICVYISINIKIYTYLMYVYSVWTVSDLCTYLTVFKSTKKTNKQIKRPLRTSPKQLNCLFVFCFVSICLAAQLYRLTYGINHLATTMLNHLILFEVFKEICERVNRETGKCCQIEPNSPLQNVLDTLIQSSVYFPNKEAIFNTTFALHSIFDHLRDLNGSTDASCQV